MTTTLLVLLGASVLVAALAFAFGRRAIAKERHRVAALAALAERLGQITATLDEPVPPVEPPPRTPAPLAPAGSRGRTALLDAVTAAVVRAREGGSRLSVALVESGSMSAFALAPEVVDIAGGDAYEVGARSVALVVPGVGRADALGVLARIEATCGASGSAVELEPGEDAVELLARLLARSAGASPDLRREDVSG